jgi:hypothetical protein
MKTIALRILFSGAVFGLMSWAYQTPPDPNAPPKISAEARAKFWRSQTEVNAASVAFEAAKKANGEAVQAMTLECGANFQLTLDQKTGEPTCAAKPVDPPATAPAPSAAPGQPSGKPAPKKEDKR